MKSRLYIGKVIHARLSPVEHRFSYPVYVTAFDLDELQQANRSITGFGYNHFNLLSLRDKHYFWGEGSIKERLLRVLQDKGCPLAFSRFEQVTMPRVLGVAFVPVSFYYCYAQDGTLGCVVAEVNNTFCQRHVYILDKPLGDTSGYPVRYRQDKQFYVSPFNSMAGYYLFSFSELGEHMRISITLFRDGQKIFVAALVGDAQALTGGNLLKTALRYPFGAALSFPRICWQAGKLYYRKKLQVQARPVPTHPMTLMIKPPTFVQRLARKGVGRALSRIKTGALVLALPDRTRQVFGQSDSPDRFDIAVRDYAFFSRLARDGDIGLGEAYTDGLWDCDKLPDLLTFLAGYLPAFDRCEISPTLISRLTTRFQHGLRRNSLRGSRHNIHDHYDLGNRFYEQFLDPKTMLYSCALFENPEDSLAQAQRGKIQRIIELADIRAEHHLLEIGCGWGGFAIEAAKQTGCRVTGITISQEQFHYAETRVRNEHLEDRVEIRLCDYRKIEGTYERIVSIEMLEAVGHAYYGNYFNACERALKPGGRAVLQVITIPDERYEHYRRNPDWIQKHIFPGGLLPCLGQLRKAMVAAPTLAIVDTHNIGNPHYIRTLECWRQCFNQHAEVLESLGYDRRFQRKWNYYFSYCQAGFARNLVDDLHIVIQRIVTQSENADHSEIITPV
jgi:cyclopropane-fatty-acyl-phospholipid synthase